MKRYRRRYDWRNREFVGIKQVIEVVAQTALDSASSTEEGLHDAVRELVEVISFMAGRMSQREQDALAEHLLFDEVPKE